jgi:Rod binding domain-containing protein
MLDIAASRTATVDVAMDAASARKPAGPRAATKDTELRKTFNNFVGDALFGQMLKSMRKTVDKPAYFHGGRTEEIFTQQLDQVLSEKLSAASADRLTEPMYELFMAGRR